MLFVALLFMQYGVFIGVGVDLMMMLYKSMKPSIKVSTDKLNRFRTAVCRVNNVNGPLCLTPPYLLGDSAMTERNNLLSD